MGEVESSAFSPLLRLFFQGKNESQKRVAASAHSSFLFLHSFVSFLRRKRRRKGNSKSNSAFSGTSSLSACGKIYAFFFQRKRKTKRQMTSGAQTSAFPLLFPLFFIFLKSKKKSKKQCKSSLLFPRLFSFSFRVPGLFVCGDFVPSSVRENVRGLFSEGRGDYEKVYTVRRSPSHIRPAKKAGAEPQSEHEKVTLIMPDGSEYPSKEVDSSDKKIGKLEEIIGLNKSQFMQIAMIAQAVEIDTMLPDVRRPYETPFTSSVSKLHAISLRSSTSCRIDFA